MSLSDLTGTPFICRFASADSSSEGKSLAGIQGEYYGITGIRVKIKPIVIGIYNNPGIVLGGGNYKSAPRGIAVCSGQGLGNNSAWTHKNPCPSHSGLSKCEYFAVVGIIQLVVDSDITRRGGNFKSLFLNVVGWLRL